MNQANTPAGLQAAILAIPCDALEWRFIDSREACFQGGHKDALRDAAALVAQHVPLWHRRPTCPGWWACAPDGNLDYSAFMLLDQDDIDRGAPFLTDAVYGPIPQRPSNTEGK